MAVATKKKSVTASAHPWDKTLIGALTALERAGKEITSLAREGKKRVKAHEGKVVGSVRASK